MRHSYMIRIFFGNPGCGKTTSAARSCFKIIRSRKKNGINHIYTNFECTLANQINLKDIGLWTIPPDSYLCIDEAGIEYNSRKYKSLPQHSIEWFKLYRHYGVKIIDIYSQSWEDMDVTLRRLADELWYVRRVGPFTMLRRIYKRVGIDDVTHQIIDKYEFGSLLPCLLPWPFHRTNIVIFPRWIYYRFFDSFSKKSLPMRSVVRPADPRSVLRALNRKDRRRYSKKK